MVTEEAGGGGLTATASTAAPSSPPVPEQRPVTVHILAELRLYRDGLEQVLKREGLEVTGAGAADPGCVDRIAGLAPDVVLLDMETPGSLPLVRRLRQAAPRSRVVAIAVPEHEQSVVACAEAGVSGYVTRDQSIEDVIASVESVARGEMIASPRLAAALLRRVTTLASERTVGTREFTLTPRELEIVALIERRKSNKQIARELCIEVNTVKNHVHSILRKLHVERRGDAVERVRAGGFELPRRLDEGLPED